MKAMILTMSAFLICSMSTIAQAENAKPETKVLVAKQSKEMKSNTPIEKQKMTKVSALKENQLLLKKEEAIETKETNQK